ncbi:helix-turn-helix transcriptional regulator [Pedobacter puniceum]|uniref:WYL domain-containing protein n=1 Tax=Pedobacter puniceum TaxID=2666136 RepID=A0A7K0FQM0_9SPHI|nr:WYL domain-containing protein [Pedobacter puniceum]MRX48268.1 WYL domain-containing protein [Pedobacter puniceum]
MSKKEVINRYSLIINRIRKSPATLKDINNYLERESEIQGYDFRISKRTLKRDLEDIFSLYKIDIQYDFSTKVYRIVSQDEPDLNNRMLEAFDTFNALNQTEGISRFIHFEKRRPNGTENFHGILHAIQNSKMIKYIYHKYWNDEISTRLIAPYGLKEFKNRWYVIGKDEKDGEVKTFGLDRITQLEITAKKFNYPSGFDLNERFANCFGIINPKDLKPEKIVLSFDVEQGKYIKSFPLHSSQQVLKDNAQEFQISLNVLTSFDFIMEILSYGDRVKIIQPKGLRNEIRNIYMRALENFR